MTLQNDHILLEEAHRRVADNLREVELDHFGRPPRRVRRAVVVTGATVIAVMAALVGVVGLLP